MKIYMAGKSSFQLHRCLLISAKDLLLLTVSWTLQPYRTHSASIRPPEPPTILYGPPAVSLDHLHCFLPLAHAHQAIVGVLHADGVRGLIDDFRGCVIQERTAGQDERRTHHGDNPHFS